MNLPNVYILGAAKCGTTSLAHQLSNHDDIFLVNGKETHFLSSDEKFAKGQQFYAKKFLVGYNKERVILDATPEYLAKPDLIIPRLHQIHQNSQHLKFIIVLRDPLARLLSHYSHRARTFNETRTIEEAVLADMERINAPSPSDWSNYFTEGLYAKHLSQWFHNFPEAHFLVLTLSDIAKNNDNSISKILHFLDLQDSGSLKHMKHENKRSKSILPAVSRMVAQQWPLKIYLKKALPKYQRRKLAKWIHLATQRPTKDRLTISDDIEHLIVQAYQKDVKQLRSMNICNTTDWKNFLEN
ncbi:sulfotransferase domain-containing protein [Planktomarina temperata]|nr:sulfotransferase domain-containing protein [Planktomarina temperata]